MDAAVAFKPTKHGDKVGRGPGALRRSWLDGDGAMPRPDIAGVRRGTRAYARPRGRNREGGPRYCSRQGSTAIDLKFLPNRAATEGAPKIKVVPNFI